jgi:hypothetical protein
MEDTRRLSHFGNPRRGWRESASLEVERVRRRRGFKAANPRKSGIIFGEADPPQCRRPASPYAKRNA